MRQKKIKININETLINEDNHKEPGHRFSVISDFNRVIITDAYQF